MSQPTKQVKVRSTSIEKKSHNIQDKRLYAFQQLWSAGEVIPTYEVLRDSYCNNYFTSRALLKQSTQLQETLSKKNIKTRDTILFQENLKKKIKNIEGQYKENINNKFDMKQNQTRKIFPYLNQMKACSKVKLFEYKQRLNLKLKCLESKDKNIFKSARKMKYKN